MKKIILFLISFILGFNFSILTFDPIEYSKEYKTEIYTSIPYKHKVNIINHGNGEVIVNNTNITSFSTFILKRFSNIEISLKPNIGYHIFKAYKNSDDITNIIENNKILLTNINEDLTIEIFFRRDSIKENPIHNILITKSKNIFKSFKSLNKYFSKEVHLKTSDENYSAIFVILTILSLTCILKYIYFFKKK